MLRLVCKVELGWTQLACVALVHLDSESDLRLDFLLWTRLVLDCNELDYVKFGSDYIRVDISFLGQGYVGGTWNYILTLAITS